MSLPTTEDLLALCTRDIRGFKILDASASLSVKLLGFALGRQWAQSWRSRCPVLYVVVPSTEWRSGRGYAPLVGHEYVHLTEQQRDGWRWYWRYATSRAFRLAAEIRAFMGELMLLDPGPFQDITTERFLDEAAVALASRTYLWAAHSVAEAHAMLASALVSLPDWRWHEPYVSLLTAGKKT